MKNTNKNFLYNIIYQVFIFIVPLMMTPYISRVLGVDQVGVYSFTYSIVSYFMLFGMIGINNYGSKTTAQVAKDKDKLSTKFWEIYFIQMILTISSIIIYSLLLAFGSWEYKTIMAIQIIYLFSTLLDINWLFFGLEKFKTTVSRNIIIKTLSIVLVFCFVRNESHLWLYTLIMSSSMLLSQVYLWICARKIIYFKKIKITNVIRHVKPCLILFIPVIAYSIYRIMDKTMIGGIANVYELGNYESAEKIINIPVGIIAALGTVMLPHMSKVEDKENESKKIMETFELGYFSMLPIIIGLLLISQDFSGLFFGEGYEKTGLIIQLLTPTILFSVTANVIRNCYLIPKSKDKIYVLSTISGAAVNLILNFIFIKPFGALGACIGTILAEFSVMFVQILYTRKDIKYKKMLHILLRYLVKSAVIIIPIVFIGCMVDNQLLRIILQISISVFIYATINYKYILFDFLGRKCP